MLTTFFAALAAAAGADDQMALDLARRTSPPYQLTVFERRELEDIRSELPPLSPSELSLLYLVATDVSRQGFDRLISVKARSYADLLSAGELHKLSRTERGSGDGLGEAQRISFERTSEALRSINFADEVRATFCRRAPDICKAE